jgi:hypothetical protein
MTTDVTRSQAEGLQFLSDYRSAFTTRTDGSSWPKKERTLLNAGRYFRSATGPESSNTVNRLGCPLALNKRQVDPLRISAEAVDFGH